MGNDVDQEKEKYIQSLDFQLKDWRNQLDFLKTRADTVFDQSRKQFEKDFDHILNNADAADAGLDALRRTNEQVWNDLRQGIERATRDLQEALDKARSRVSSN